MILLSCILYEELKEKLFTLRVSDTTIRNIIENLMKEDLLKKKHKNILHTMYASIMLNLCYCIYIQML